MSVLRLNWIAEERNALALGGRKTVQSCLEASELELGIQLRTQGSAPKLRRTHMINAYSEKLRTCNLHRGSTSSTFLGHIRKSATETVSRQPEHTGRNSQRAVYNRQIVTPMIYSLLSPLVLPLLAERTIWGSQIMEYVAATKIIERVGDRITRTIRVRKTNSVTQSRAWGSVRM